MSKYLLPGPTIFTLKRIQKQLRDDIFRKDPAPPGVPPQFQNEDLGHSFEGGVHRIYTAGEQEERRKSICHELYERVLDGKSHCLIGSPVSAQHPHILESCWDDANTSIQDPRIAHRVVSACVI